MSVIELTAKIFDDSIQKNPIVVIDFWAPWCGPCRAFAPVFESVAAANPDVLFCKINTDQEQELAAKFQIRSIPTLAIFKEQEVIFYQPGMLPKDALEELIIEAKKVDMEIVRAEIAKDKDKQELK